MLKIRFLLLLLLLYYYILYEIFRNICSSDIYCRVVRAPPFYY